MREWIITRRALLKAITSAVSLASIPGCHQKSPDGPLTEDEFTATPIPIDLPIDFLRRLHKFKELLETKFPPKSGYGMGRIGLELSRKLENGGYWCTPENSLNLPAPVVTGSTSVWFKWMVRSLRNRRLS